jgi:hypothetical protein
LDFKPLDDRLPLALSIPALAAMGLRRSRKTRAYSDPGFIEICACAVSGHFGICLLASVVVRRLRAATMIGPDFRGWNGDAGRNFEFSRVRRVARSLQRPPTIVKS